MKHVEQARYVLTLQSLRTSYVEIIAKPRHCDSSGILMHVFSIDIQLVITFHFRQNKQKIRLK